MTNEEFPNLVLQHFQKVSEKLDSVDRRQTKLELLIETEVAEITQALFEANQVQEERYKHVMERPDSIEIDTGYLVSRVATL